MGDVYRVMPFSWPTLSKTSWSNWLFLPPKKSRAALHQSPDASGLHTELDGVEYLPIAKEVVCGEFVVFVVCEDVILCGVPLAREPHVELHVLAALFGELELAVFVCGDFKGRLLVFDSFLVVVFFVAMSASKGSRSCGNN